MFGDVRTVFETEPELEQLYEDFSFENIDSHLLDPAHWHSVFGAPLQFQESVHMCEARGLLATIKHCSRNSLMHRHHIAILGDNLGLVLCSAKGRCAHYPLLRLLQRMCAECIAANIIPRYRWVPSELNRADTLSRLWGPARLRAGNISRHGRTPQYGDTAVQPSMECHSAGASVWASPCWASEP